MIATVGGVAIARGAHALLWRTPKLAHGHDERVLEEAAVVHVGEKRRQPLVEHRSRLVLHPLVEPDVVVPRVVVGIRHLRPDHLHHPRARLDEAACQQQALSERVATVGLANRSRLTLEGEGLAGPSGDHEPQGLFVVFVELVVGHRLVELRHRTVDDIP